MGAIPRPTWDIIGWFRRCRVEKEERHVVHGKHNTASRQSQPTNRPTNQLVYEAVRNTRTANLTDNRKVTVRVLRPLFVVVDHCWL